MSAFRDPDFMAEYNRLRALDIEAQRKPVVPGRVIVTVIPVDPDFSYGQGRDRRIAVTMAQLDRMIARSERRHREREAARRRGWQPAPRRIKPYVRPEYAETPKGWTLCES